MANRSQSKGKKGEKEALNWLLGNLPIVNLSTTNLTRFMEIGDDIELLDFSFEIKRREVLDIQSWWYQCVVNADNKNKEPVLMFRQNRKNWRFIISARHLGISKGYIELSRVAFIEFMSSFIENEHKPYAQG